MSSTAIVWLLTFVALAVASFRRPVYASLAYLMTFFASPLLWWFGDGLLSSITMRWNFVAVGVLLVAVLNGWGSYPPLSRAGKVFLVAVALIAFNALLVNEFLADYPPESDKVFDILWKGCLASTLIFFSLRNQDDLELLLFGVVVGCGFVGYQIVMAGQGSIEGGRLEGFGFPGAQGANGGAAVVSLGLLLAGYFVVATHRKYYAAVSLLLVPLMLETVLRCNSRGAYLGLAAAAMVMLASARGATRTRAIALCAVGSLAFVAMARNDAVWERIQSIFVDAEERDNSAAERLLSWTAALEMISDYPLGSGGEAAFTSPRGVHYIAHFRPEFRSVHNGVLDIAGGWGIQGLLLFLTALAVPAVAAKRTAKIDNRNANVQRAFLGTVLIAILADQFVAAMFTSILDGEWFLWLATFCLIYARTVQDEDESDLDESDLDESEQGARDRDWESAESWVR